MKAVFPTCCGVDVHKTFVVATIITTPADSLQPHYRKKRFSTFNSDLSRFADWLLKNNCLDVCMESTGKYWFRYLTSSKNGVFGSSLPIQNG